MLPFGDSDTFDITPAEVQNRLSKGDTPLIIDVREPEEYAEGHIPGSILRPLGQIQDWIKELDKQAEAILVCRSGRRSAYAFQFMDTRGFHKLRNMSGGMLAWQGPLERP